LAVSSILWTARNHKEPCQENRANLQKAMLGQETLDKLWWTSWGIVMMQLPVACSTAPSPGPKCITKMTQDFLVVLLTDSFA
jgi:hypothetical protein